MYKGVKLQLVYHFYCKDSDSIKIGEGNAYNELHRRCLQHYHNLFDSSLFCICIDNKEDNELIKAAIDWIYSCGFKNNVTIKIKDNSPYYDAKTFFDEIVDNLVNFDSMVFFAHNKGCKNTFDGESGVKKWIAYSYFSCLDKIERHLSELSEAVVACTYLPIQDEFTKNMAKNRWIAPGTIFMLNPQKVKHYINSYNIETPKLIDRFSAEQFLPNLFDIERPPALYRIMFDTVVNFFAYKSGVFNFYSDDHDDLISLLLPKERVEEYKNFFEKISEGINFEQ